MPAIWCSRHASTAANSCAGAKERVPLNHFSRVGQREHPRDWPRPEKPRVKEKTSLASNLAISKRALPASGADGKAESGRNGLVYFQVLSCRPQASPRSVRSQQRRGFAQHCLALGQIPSDAGSPWCSRATGCHPERPGATKDSRRPGASGNLPRAACSRLRAAPRGESESSCALPSFVRARAPRNPSWQPLEKKWESKPKCPLRALQWRSTSWLRQSVPPSAHTCAQDYNTI